MTASPLVHSVRIMNLLVMTIILKYFYVQFPIWFYTYILPYNSNNNRVKTRAVEQNGNIFCICSLYNIIYTGKITVRLSVRHFFYNIALLVYSIEQ